MAEWKLQPETVIKLINNYAQFECLWNHRHEQYKMIDLQTNAWLLLSHKFGISVEEIKCKIKYLENAYVQEKKKVDDSKKSGASLDEIYRPNLFYYNEFSFLDSVTNCHIEDAQVDSQPDLNILNVSEGNSLQVRPPQSPLHFPSGSTSVSSTKNPRKKSQKSYSDPFDKAIDAIVKHATSSEPETIYMSFSRLIGFQLNQLTPFEATVAMAFYSRKWQFYF